MTEDRRRGPFERFMIQGLTALIMSALALLVITIALAGSVAIWRWLT